MCNGIGERVQLICNTVRHRWTLSLGETQAAEQRASAEASTDTPGTAGEGAAGVPAPGASRRLDNPSRVPLTNGNDIIEISALDLLLTARMIRIFYHVESQMKLLIVDEAPKEV
jgi:hypothetical protein